VLGSPHRSHAYWDDSVYSSNSKQLIVHCGHYMELEAQDAVSAAIRQVVASARHHGKL
jgi:hypothetical protein